jgi:hypothetical protein
MEVRRQKRRGRGRPRRTWEDCVIDAVRRKGKTLAYLRRLARDRSVFRRWTQDPALQGNGGGGIRRRRRRRRSSSLLAIFWRTQKKNGAVSQCNVLYKGTAYRHYKQIHFSKRFRTKTILASKSHTDEST